MKNSMSKILIDNYRGFDIEFETINEKFQCIITDELVKESISFSAIKKFVDEYKKINQDYEQKIFAPQSGFLTGWVHLLCFHRNSAPLL